ALDELFASGLAEGVVITAPTDLHLRLVGDCVRAGVPVFCEKPCGLSADQAGQAAAVASAAGLPLQVGYYRRFLPELVALRQRIAAGRLGELSLVVLNQWDEHPPSAEFERRSGGIVVDMGVHEIDQLRWLTGQEVEQVAALTPAPGDQSSAVISLRLSGGTLGAITLGRRFPHPDSCWMEVVGTAGYERLPFVWAEQGEKVVLAGIAAELDAFAAAVRGAPMAGPGGADAVAALEVAEQIDRCLR
ncbi:MAG TPA: Gfo/Idh/MocA family oxidoreductase, partial [Gaiellales bacterium]|nr:Gfo/Idh/MocA family oxidoreductase [Gaiellales bacterium]